MQSIENITLENWPVSSESSETKEATYHFALRQEGVNLDFHFEKFFRNKRLSFHYFNSFDELTIICHRFPIDAIVIGGRSDFLRELDMVKAIKENILLSIVPVILYHPEPDPNTVVAAYEHGVAEFIYGEWMEKLFEVRVGRVLDRSHRDLAVNPSTSLPGPGLIEQEINRQLAIGEEFAVCYADLDNFKAFNDYYGYVYGDKIIRLTGRILRDIVFDLCREGFVGHIAGDDYICVIPVDLVDDVCKWIIRCFDAFVWYRYEEEDRERGFIETANRRGRIERYPILSISIAVIINRHGEFKHIGELSRMLADLKKATKALPGSNYMLERRKKY
ncbi:MAG: diguanylate cyclase [bacterium]|nr:diguanylate cyclase [bacterium]